MSCWSRLDSALTLTTASSAVSRVLKPVDSSSQHLTLHIIGSSAHTYILSFVTPAIERIASCIAGNISRSRKLEETNGDAEMIVSDDVFLEKLAGALAASYFVRLTYTVMVVVVVVLVNWSTP